MLHCQLQFDFSWKPDNNIDRSRQQDGGLKRTENPAQSLVGRRGCFISWNRPRSSRRILRSTRASSNTVFNISITSFFPPGIGRSPPAGCRRPPSVSADDGGYCIMQVAYPLVSHCYPQIISFIPCRHAHIRFVNWSSCSFSPCGSRKTAIIIRIS